MKKFGCFPYFNIVCICQQVIRLLVVLCVILDLLGTVFHREGVPAQTSFLQAVRARCPRRARPGQIGGAAGAPLPLHRGVSHFYIAPYVRFQDFLFVYRTLVRANVIAHFSTRLRGML